MALAVSRESRSQAHERATGSPTRIVPPRTTSAFRASLLSKRRTMSRRTSGSSSQRVGIDRRHDTSRAQRVQPNDRISPMCSSASSHSRSAKPVDTADDDVRAQAADVASERGNSTVGRDEQRQNVESVESLARLEPGVGAGGIPDERERVRAIPWMTVDQGAAVRDRASRAAREAGTAAATCAHPPVPARGRSDRRPSRPARAWSLDTRSPASDFTG